MAIQRVHSNDQQGNNGYLLYGQKNDLAQLQQNYGGTISKNRIGSYLFLAEYGQTLGKNRQFSPFGLNVIKLSMEKNRLKLFKLSLIMEEVTPGLY